jgi:hypothetical protein
MSLAPACVLEHGIWLFVEPGVHLLDTRKDRAVPEHASAVTHRLEMRVRVDHLRDKLRRARRDMPVGARAPAVPQVSRVALWRRRRRHEVRPLALSRFRIGAQGRFDPLSPTSAVARHTARRTASTPWGKHGAMNHSARTP